MSPEECQAFLREMREEVQPLYKQVEGVAASTLRLRPVFLRKQPFEKRCEMIRKAMALKANAETASEVLAGFFIERYTEELGELLDSLKIKHKEGVLQETSPAAPGKKLLTQAVKKFREGENPQMRLLLLKAFTAQSAIDWPELDEIVFPEGTAVSS
jgi:hypothetical protein